MNPQYEILAKCLLPTHMLECFELTNVEVKPKEKTATQDTESDESPVNVIHLYLVNRSTNASAESLNANIKDFRAQLRGVIDKKFFIFRLVKIFG